jgi:hypothetical protein
MPPQMLWTWLSKTFSAITLLLVRRVMYISYCLFYEHLYLEQGKWIVSVKSFRTVSNPESIRMDRTMHCVTLNNRTFPVLEDQGAPQLVEFASLSNRMPSPPVSSPSGASRGKSFSDGILPPPPHYRTTLVTTEPVGALESLLSQLGTHWTSTRLQTAASKNQQASSGNQLVVEGSIFATETDWRVRAGNVYLAGGALKGVFIEVCKPASSSNFSSRHVLIIILRPNICPYQRLPRLQVKARPNCFPTCYSLSCQKSKMHSPSP